MLAEQIQTDLTTAMKARNPLEVAVLRMALAGIKEARVSGSDVRELTDDDVLAVLAKEAKRREEAAAAFADGGRAESAQKELAERDILARYLPAPRWPPPSASASCTSAANSSSDNGAGR